MNFDFVFRHVCQVQLLFVFCHFILCTLANSIFELRHKQDFCIFKAQNSPKNSCERCQSDFINSILPRRISNALHSLFPKKQARLLRIALLQRLRRGSAAARGDGQVQRMARYSGTQVNPRGGGQPSTTLTTVCYSTNIYIFTLTRRHTHTRCEPKAHERRQTN